MSLNNMISNESAMNGEYDSSMLAVVIGGSSTHPNQI